MTSRQHETGEALYLPARAKLNLVLKIVGRRQDGYHLLDTVFHAIALHDDVAVARAERSSIEVSADEDRLFVAADESNLASRAAELVGRELGAARQGGVAMLLGVAVVARHRAAAAAHLDVPAHVRAMDHHAAVEHAIVAVFVHAPLQIVGKDPRPHRLRAYRRKEIYEPADDGCASGSIIRRLPAVRQVHPRAAPLRARHHGREEDEHEEACAVQFLEELSFGPETSERPPKKSPRGTKPRPRPSPVPVA